MQPLRYDLRLLFVVMPNVCVLAWAVSYTASPIAILLFAAVASLTCIWCRAEKSKRSKLTLGAIGGFAAMTILFIYGFGRYIAGYFYNTDNPEYFEDGLVISLVVVPLFVFTVFGVSGAIIGMICGAAVWGIQKLTIVNEGEN